jgi:hypothetical protein
MSNSGNQNNPPAQPIDEDRREPDERADQDSDRDAAPSTHTTTNPRVKN